MEGNSSRIGATGSAKNAPVLVNGLSGAVLEDEEGNEDNDAVSDASEEGSEDSEGAGHADNDCIDFAYPLAASWSEVRVDALPEGAPLNFGLPELLLLVVDMEGHTSLIMLLLIVSGNIFDFFIQILYSILSYLLLIRTEH